MRILVTPTFERAVKKLLAYRAVDENTLKLLTH